MKLLTLALLVGTVAPLSAESLHFECGHHFSLQAAIEHASPGETIQIFGACKGPLVITKNLTLIGLSNASINGDGKDTITIVGPARVKLTGLDIYGGINGVVAKSGAQLTLTSTRVHDNTSIGVLVEGASSLTLTNASTTLNGLNGVDAEATSAVIITGSFASSENGVFGMNINTSSSLTLQNANVTVEKNTLGVQLGTSAGGFIADPVSVLTVKDNVTTGLTIVSGAHMVDFGGSIVTTGNGFHGVSVDSKAGFDLDAAGSLTSTGNGKDGLHLEETSVATIFNTTAFSGAPGNTTLTTQNNMGNGISVLTGSNLTMVNQAVVNSNGNSKLGVQVDNGSSLTLIQSNVTSNTQKDVLLTFGSRGDFSGNAIGSISCDATVLLRGDTGATCPH